MKRMQRVFGDLDSLRFVDGLFGNERRADFLNHIAGDQCQADRVAMWSRQNEMIRAAFAGVTLESIPLSLRVGVPGVSARVADGLPKERKIHPQPMQVARAAGKTPPVAAVVGDIAYFRPPARLPAKGSAHPYRLPLGAAILLLLAMLLAYGAYGAHPTTPHAWDEGPSDVGSTGSGSIARAADAYSTYALDAVRPVEFSASQVQALNGWIARRVGVGIVAPDLTTEGWLFLGGRLVAGSGQPAAFYVYEDGSGERLSVFVTLAPGDASPGVALGRAGEVGASMAWRSGPRSYVVTVGRTIDWLSRNAEQLKAGIMRKPG